MHVDPFICESPELSHVYTMNHSIVPVKIVSCKNRKVNFVERQVWFSTSFVQLNKIPVWYLKLRTTIFLYCSEKKKKKNWDILRKLIIDHKNTLNNEIPNVLLF